MTPTIKKNQKALKLFTLHHSKKAHPKRVAFSWVWRSIMEASPQTCTVGAQDFFSTYQILS